MVRYVGDFVRNGQFTVIDSTYYDDGESTREKDQKLKEKYKRKHKSRVARLGRAELNRRLKENEQKRLARLKEFGIQHKGNNNG